MGIREFIEVRPDQYDILIKLIEKFLPQEEIWAFGSRIKGSSTEKSDLDLVVFSGKKQTMKIGELKEAFEESDLIFRVDLLVWDEIPEQFHKNIQAEHFVIQKRSYK